MTRKLKPPNLLVLLLIVSLVIFFQLSTYAQNTYFVKSGGSGAGMSWTNAFGDLQEAIDSCQHGDQIWIAEGIYYPTREFDADGSGVTSNREKTFYIDKNIAIYGGFYDGGLDLLERDFELNQTILSGDIGVLEDTSDNTYHVVIIDGSTPTINITMDCILDGIHVEYGVASGGASPHAIGSAIYLTGAGAGNECSPILRNCAFTENYASYGGTIYNYALGGTCSPQFINCRFVDNYTYAGAGVFNNAYGGLCESKFLNCIFEDNEASYAGGVLYNYGNYGVLDLTVSNCSFINNTTQIGGAMYNSSMGGTLNASIVNSVFVHNFAHHKGGALFNYGYDGVSQVDVINSTFYQNTGVHNGGTMRNWYASSSIVNSILWDNGDEIYNTFGSANLLNSLIDDGSPGNGSITYNDMVTGMNVIDLNPQFCDAVGSVNLRLKQSSPAIDKGNPDTTGLGLPSFDLDGKNRLNKNVDLGAYENPFVNCPDAFEVDKLYLPMEDLYQAKLEIKIGTGINVSQANVSLNAPCVLIENNVSVDVGGSITISSGGCFP